MRPPLLKKSTRTTGKVGTILLGGANGFVYAVDPGNDNSNSAVILKWRLEGSLLDNRMVIDNDILYVTSIKDSFLYALDLINRGYLGSPYILWRAEHVNTIPALLPNASVVVGSLSDSGGGEIAVYKGGAAFR